MTRYLATLALLAPLITHATTLGLHLVTAHTKNPDLPPVAQPHSSTPGIYALLDNNVSLGVVRNSYGRVSTYVAQTFAMLPWLDLTLGFITGYDKRRIYGQDACTQGYTHNCWWDLGHSRALLRPLVALSVPHRIDDVHTVRFSLLGSGLHLSIERRFP